MQSHNALKERERDDGGGNDDDESDLTSCCVTDHGAHLAPHTMGTKSLFQE
jgi:hypothetical protein